MYDCYYCYVMNVECEMYQVLELKVVICNVEMIKCEIVEDFDIDVKKIYVIYNLIDFICFVLVEEV